MVKTKINRRKKLLKRTKKQRKFYSGGGVDLKNEKTTISSHDEVPKEGIIDMLKDKVTGMVKSAGDFAADKGLRLFGLQPIRKKESVDESVDKLGDAASNVVSDVESVGANIANVANKGSAAILENINEVLGSPQVNKTITQAAEHTKDIIEKQLESINKIASEPRFKEEAKKALDNAAEYADIAVDALNKPLDKAIDKLNEAGEKAASGAVSGSIKVATDAMAAVPGAGAIVEAGKMINDISKAASSVVEAGSEATSTLSDLYLDTTEKIKKGMKELEEKKKLAENISNRTSESIKEFENPIKNLPSISKYSNNNNQSAGSKLKSVIKTKKKLDKPSGKSKRVRFVL